MKPFFLASVVFSIFALSAKTTVMLNFDTEDFTCDRSNDAIRDLAKIMTEEGIVGHFNIVGLLAEELVRLRRFDVIDALKPHLIGTQTYGHSLHPAICEQSDKEDFREAYNDVMMHEAQGIGMIRAATGCDKILFQDPPGNSVSYVSFYVYHDLGLKFICGCGFTDHPMDSKGAYGAGLIVRKDNRGMGLWYCNMYMVPYSHAFTLEDFLPVAGRPAPDPKAMLDRIAGRDLVMLYMHPHMAVKKAHWDGPNYKRRNHVEWRKWIQVADRSQADTDEFYRRFREFCRLLKRDDRFEISDLSKFEKTLRPQPQIALADIPSIRKSLLRRFSAVDLPKSWSVSDVFQATLSFLRGEKDFQPKKSWGFLRRPRGIAAPVTLSAKDLRASASRINPDWFVPDEINVGGTKVGPADFLFASLEILDTAAESVTILPRIDQLGSFEEVPALELVDIKGGWCIHADTFEDRYCSERLKLQLWTLRIE